MSQSHNHTLDNHEVGAIIPTSRDEVIPDPILEKRAIYLIEHLIRPGQRLCMLENAAGGKKANPLAGPSSPSPFLDGFDPTVFYWRNLVRRHVTGQQATVTLRYKSDDDPMNGDVTTRWFPKVMLGMYYGGQSGIGNNQVGSFGLDCDKSVEHALELERCAAKEDRDRLRAKWEADPAELEAEKTRLQEMLDEAQGLYPKMVFFRKEKNGKWHGHANLKTPMDANVCKEVVTASLPDRWRIDGKVCVEVFPKAAMPGELKEYGVGNQVRLPLNAASGYEPLDFLLPPIEPMELPSMAAGEDSPSIDYNAVVEVNAPAGVAASATPAGSAVKQTVSPNNEEAMRGYVFSVNGIGYQLPDRIARYRAMLMSPKFKPSISGNKGHDACYHAACMRFGFAVPIEDARPVLSEYNTQKCSPPWSDKELEHKLATSRCWPDKQVGWLLPEGTSKKKEDISEEDEEFEKNAAATVGHAHMPPPPSREQLLMLIRGTPLETVVREVERVVPDVNPLLPIAGGITLAGAWLAPRVRIGSPGNSFIPNVYALLAAESTSGKGTTSRGILAAAKASAIERLDEGSEKRLLRQLGEDPWGLLNICELSQYLDKRNWKYAVLGALTKAFDSDMVSCSTMTTGDLRVWGAAPSCVAEIQPRLFWDCPSAQLIESGYFPRVLVAYDSRVSSEHVVLGQLGQRCEVDGQVIADAFSEVLGWLPMPMSPAEEEREIVALRGDKEERRGKGEWVHPQATSYLAPEPYVSILEQRLVPSRLKAMTIRLRTHYLPLIAVFFETRENLEAGQITTSALTKADVVALALWHSARQFYQNMPDSRDGGNKGHSFFRST